MLFMLMLLLLMMMLLLLVLMLLVLMLMLILEIQETQEEKGKQQLSWWRRLLNRLLTSRGRGQAVKKGEKQQNRLEYL